MAPMGFEPTTPALRARCSDQAELRGLFSLRREELRSPKTKKPASREGENLLDKFKKWYLTVVFLVNFLKRGF
jgi:hypothetical protein